jgi:uncharacterized protein (TIGR02453 family)
VWPPAALDFLRELEDNNDSAWFKANRARYDEYLLGPARRLADQLTDLGEPHFFRPYRDTRFRPGPPLKEQIAFGLGAGVGATGGYYLELSLDGLLVGAGLHHPAPDQLERFRAAIDDGRRAAVFERAIANAEAAGLTPIEPALRRAPKGYSPNHPRIERLRMKELTVFRRHRLEPWLHTPACDERIRAEFESARPLINWLSGTVGPSTRPHPR